jgi:hypothetical protein
MGRRAILIGMICAAPLAANAAMLPIDGNYGNAAGCQLAGDGEYNPDDMALLLTPSEINTSVSLCSFDQIHSDTDGSHSVSMTCAFEGSGPEENTTETTRISGAAATGYTIQFSDGTSWGPLIKC